jgi:hypothetical protein
VRCGQGDVAVYAADNDFKDLPVARAVRKSFTDTFGEGPVRVGMAPKSMMIYQGVGGQRKMTSPVWRSPDGQEHRFELLGNGQQFVAFGTHPDTGREYSWPNGSIDAMETWELIELDFALVSQWIEETLPTLIPEGWVIVEGGSDGGVSGDMLDNIKPTLDITKEQLVEYVSCLNVDGSYDEWLSVGAAIAHQLGQTDEAYEVWAEHYRKGSKWVERTSRYKWKSFTHSTSRKVSTAATIIMLARETDAWKDLNKAKKVEALDGWLERIAACADAHDVERLCRDEISADLGLSAVDRAQIERALVSKLAEAGVTLPIKDVRAMIKARASRQSVGTVQMENWCADYVWCQSEDCFIDVPTQEPMSVQSFNATYGRNVKGRWLTPDGGQLPASHVALQELQIPCVARRMYLPMALERFSLNGLDYLNRYRPSLVPESKAHADWTSDDHEAVKMFGAHIKLLCGASANHMLDWMAFNVQNPGVKIRWSPVIKGIEGDGKTLLGEVMGLVMGSENVLMISPKVLLTDFNGWAEGHCVGVFEELRLTGHSRYDAGNAIKPNITNDNIPIHRKGMDEYNIINTTNYIAFTNHADALPLSDADRRWMVVFSPFNKYEQLRDHIGGDAQVAAYFTRLFDLVRSCASALREWLLQRDVKHFNRNGRAPDSAEKQAMIAASMHEEDEDILTIIKGGYAGVSDQIISTAHLTTHLLMLPGAEIPKGRALAAAMTRLGFMRRKEQVWWDGKACRCWVADVKLLATVSDARILLDATVLPVDAPF